MKLGIFGGTFDPIHLGHLILAEQCREQGVLDRIVFVPSARPPHKQDHAPAPFHYRLEMVKLAIAGHPQFDVDDVEMDRPGPSYTVDTLEELMNRHERAQLSLLLGADALMDLPQWREPDRIGQLANLLVLPREGSPDPTEISWPNQLSIIESPTIEISSTMVRDRLRSARTIRWLVPRAVECYIQQHGLYEQQ